MNNAASATTVLNPDDVFTADSEMLTIADVAQIPARSEIHGLQTRPGRDRVEQSKGQRPIPRTSHFHHRGAQ